MADHRHQQPVGGVNGDPDVDVLEQRCGSAIRASYQAFSPGSARTATAIARSTRVV